MLSSPRVAIRKPLRRHKPGLPNIRKRNAMFNTNLHNRLIAFVLGLATLVVAASANADPPARVARFGLSHRRRKLFTGR
jgi:hypothetical protein